MGKRTWWVGLFFVLAASWCASAYASQGHATWYDFWGGIGGFVYNALPWNWGHWAGQSL